MTWPPPSIAPLPPPRPHRPVTSAPAVTARPVAASLAATGGALVLVAAVVVVAGNWQDISPALRFAGLVAVTVGLGAAAERSRNVVPATARAVAHLTTALTAPVGIAAAAVVGGTWPVCVVTGGVLAAAVCTVQARRWQAPLLDAAGVIAVGLALVGIAALVPLPVGVLAVVAAGGLLAIRRDAAAAALAAAAAASPLLVALAEQRIGDGTLARVGATGDVLAWSAPLAGVLAGGVLAVVASRRNAPAAAVIALAAPLVGVTTGLATRGVDAVVWWCLPAVVLAALELVLAMATTDPWRSVTRPIADGVAATASVVALVLPPIAAAEHHLSGDVPILPLLLATAALAMTAMRTNWSIGALSVAGVGSLVIAITVAFGWPLVVTAAVAVAVAAGATVVTGGRWLAVLPAMVTGAGFLVASAGPPAGELAVSLALLALAVGVACRERTGRTLDVPLTLATFAGAAVAAAAAADHWASGYVAALAVAVAVVAVRSPIRAPGLMLPVMCAAGAATIGSFDDPWVGAGLLALSMAAALTWWRTRETWTGHVAAAVTIVAVPFGLTAIGASGGEAAVTMLIFAVVLTGTSFLVVTSGPVATAAMTASAVAAALTPATMPILVSLAVVVFGLQLVLEGLVRAQPPMSRAGAGIAAAGAITTWWSSGTHDAVIDWLAPYGVTSGDLGVAAVSVLLLAAGAYAGRVRTLSSWATAGPGVAVLALWSVAAQLTRSVDWSVPVALGVGIVAVAVASWRRLAAPLIIGTATVAATMLVSAGPRLAELDAWMWLALGGLGLMGVAVLVERTVSADRTPIDWRGLRSTSR